jgi:hypothetical protein
VVPTSSEVVRIFVMSKVVQCEGKLLWLDLGGIQNECGKGGKRKREEICCHLLVECKKEHELSRYLVGHLHRYCIATFRIQ